MKLISLSRVRGRRPGAVATRPERPHPRPRHRGWVVAGLVVLAMLLVIQFGAPPLVRQVINRKLAVMPDFIGHVDGVKLALWRAGVDVRGFQLYERRFEHEPLLQVERASVAFAPGALLRGKIGGRMAVEGAQVHLVKRIDENTSAGGRDDDTRKAELKEEAREKVRALKRWQDELRTAMPMELTRFELTDGRVRIVDNSKQPQAELVLQRLHIVATGLQNRPKANGDPLPARLMVEAVFAGGGQLRAAAQVDPLAEQPRFTSTFEVRDLALTPVNGFLLAYANADVSRGTFEVYSELEARDGRYEGYVKPLFHDLDFRTASDRDKNSAELLAKKVVSAVASALENDEAEQVATRVPISGDFSQTDVDVWTTIATLFRNAFVEALRGGFEGQSPRR